MSTGSFRSGEWRQLASVVAGADGGDDGTRRRFSSAVLAKMQARCEGLYADEFNHHGPLRPYSLQREAERFAECHGIDARHVPLVRETMRAVMQLPENAPRFEFLDADAFVVRAWWAPGQDPREMP